VFCHWFPKSLLKSSHACCCFYVVKTKKAQNQGLLVSLIRAFIGTYPCRILRSTDFKCPCMEKKRSACLAWKRKEALALQDFKRVAYSKFYYVKQNCC
jgi:hypothetical protein